MTPGTDFKFRDDMYKIDKGETVPIQILIEPYKDVIVRYTQVGIKEQENGTAVLRFAYDILDVGRYSELYLRKDKRFEQHLGILLNYLILEAAETKEDADRENYSEEPIQERTVHKEGPSVPEV